MGRTAIFSVIFPANRPYFRDFLESLKNQSNNKFDLLLVVDSIPDIESALTEYRPIFNIVVQHFSGSIATIRWKGLNWARSFNYDFILFADTDDLLDEHRVAVCVEALNLYPIVINDLKQFYDKDILLDSGIWCNRIRNQQSISVSDIVTYNVAGLGNSAMHTELMVLPDIPENLFAVDWYLFFHWMQKVNGTFLHDGCTFYRQHGQNTAGVRSVDERRILHIAEVKIRHYNALIRDFQFLQDELKKQEYLYSRLKEDSRFLESATHRINANQINYFWWEETNYLYE